MICFSGLVPVFVKGFELSYHIPKVIRLTMFLQPSHRKRRTILMFRCSSSAQGCGREIGQLIGKMSQKCFGVGLRVWFMQSPVPRLPLQCISRGGDLPLHAATERLCFTAGTVSGTTLAVVFLTSGLAHGNPCSPAVVHFCQKESEGEGVS